MSLESAVQAILERGKAEASQILEDARAERDRMLADVRGEAMKYLADVELQAKTEAERKHVQALARAELEARKIVLVAQKEALDRVYEGALARLGRLPENADIVRALLKANESEWRSDGKVFCNTRDEPLVRKITGMSFAGSIDCEGGVVIESADGSRRIDLRYESILRDVWDDSVKEVAQTIWPSNA